MWPAATEGRACPAEDTAGAEARGLESTRQALASGLHVRKAVGDGMGRVSWERVIEKELSIRKGCSGNAHRKGETRAGHPRLLRREEETAAQLGLGI